MTDTVIVDVNVGVRVLGDDLSVGECQSFKASNMNNGFTSSKIRQDCLVKILSR